MPKEPEIKRLLKPLVGADPDLHYFKRELIIGPVRHIVRLITFHRSRFEGEAINLSATLVPLCDHSFGLVQGCGYCFNLPSHWHSADPPEPQSATLAGEVIPAMKKVETLEQTMEVWRKRILVVEPLLAKGYAMLGEFGLAGRELERCRYNYFNRLSPGLGDRLIKAKEHISVADKRALLAVMHRGEAEKAKELKLDKRLWKPSLFPAEITDPRLRVLAPDGTIAEE